MLLLELGFGGGGGTNRKKNQNQTTHKKKRKSKYDPAKTELSRVVSEDLTARFSSTGVTSSKNMKL